MAPGARNWTPPLQVEEPDPAVVHATDKTVPLWADLAFPDGHTSTAKAFAQAWTREAVRTSGLRTVSRGTPGWPPGRSAAESWSKAILGAVSERNKITIKPQMAGNMRKSHYPLNAQKTPPVQAVWLELAGFLVVGPTGIEPMTSTV